MDAVVAREYSHISDWLIFRLQRRTVLKALEKIKPDGLIVDIGCGPGHLAHDVSRNPGTDVIGLDVDSEMLDLAQENWRDKSPGLSFLAADVHRLPFKTGSIGCMISSLSLHHWADAPLAFAEIFRVLRPGGQFLIYDLCREDSRFFYFLLWLGQNLLAPAAILRTRGGTGSLWASYTRSELENIISELPLKRYHVRQQLFWLLSFGQKP